MMIQTERDALIERYAEGFSLIRAAYDRMPDEAKKWKPAPEKWSAHEVICHCADSEGNGALRIRFLVAEINPTIFGYDQDRWCELLDYESHSIELAFDTVRAVRANTVPLLKKMKDDDWAKEGTHTESGRYAAEKWLRIYAEHLEIHARQIDRNREAWEKQGPGFVGS